jgi:uncharacterized protein (TIGR03083 family)
VSIDRLYEDTRARIVDLLADLPPETYDEPVRACPGWRVRDVVAHLMGITEDALAGRLTGVPTEQQTAEQVGRCREVPLAAVIDRWEQASPEFERLIEAMQIWPAVIDIVSHEHDIRAAVQRPGARDTDAVRVVSDTILRFAPPVPLTIEVEDDRIELGTGSPDRLLLRTSRWEVLRWRMGRRSRAQLAAMDWSDDPGPVLDHLVVFGPATADVIE